MKGINTKLGAANSEKGSPSGLRPGSLSEFIGQSKVRSNLGTFIGAAKRRGETLDHALFSGPPGLGKTTLASLIARELEVGFKMTAGPTLEKQKDLAALLACMDENDVLFIDEIHRLPRLVEEALYPAMEDFCLDVIVGSGEDTKMLKLPIPKFTLVGATTRSGMLTGPLRSRFGINCRLDFYSPDELAKIVTRAAGVSGWAIKEDAAFSIARCSRGTPRTAIHLLKRVRDFLHSDHGVAIDTVCVAEALSAMEIDEFGLNENDRMFVLTIIEKFRGGPVGIDAVAAAMSEDRQTIEDEYEPYLLQEGYIERTPKGRIATAKAYGHFVSRAVDSRVNSSPTSLHSCDEAKRAELDSPPRRKSPARPMRPSVVRAVVKYNESFYCAKKTSVTTDMDGCPHANNTNPVAPECIVCKVKIA
jgi:Holliday junction DNA helicase RuvB